jgi:hypothetical protein
VVRLIAGTTTKGLSDEELADVNLKPDKFHGEWNYTIHPSIKA